MKKKIILFLAVIIPLIVTVSCREKKPALEKHAGTEFYKNILPIFSYHDKEKGIERITPEIASKISSYKFTYDESGKLTSVEYTKNDTLVDSPVLGCAKIKYAYDGPMQVKFFFNSGEEPVESNGIFAYQYSYNSSGERAGMMFLDRNGVMVNNKDGIHAWQWTRTDDGNVIKESKYSLEGKEVLPEALLKYNRDGELSEIKNIDKSGNQVDDPISGVSLIKYRYDDAGNCTETLKFNKENSRLN